MFDASIRNIIDPGLTRIGTRIAKLGISANTVTWLGFALGGVAALAIANHWMLSGLLFLLLSRLCDGLDGTVARANPDGSGQTDLGGFLDIVLDFAFYGMIPFAFILVDPEANAVAGSLLLLVFYANGASFLTFALMAEKRGIAPDKRGTKSLLYTAGLAEAGETLLVFVLFCLFPAWFSTIALVFAAIVLLTTVSRILLAYQTFR